MANICVYAAQDKNKPVAIIVPAEPALKSVAKQNGIEGGSLEELVHNDKLNGIILSEMQAAGKKGGLNGIEIIQGVVLAEEEWTPQNVSTHMHLVNSSTLTDTPSELGYLCPEVEPQEHLGEVQEGSRQGLLLDY